MKKKIHIRVLAGILLLCLLAAGAAVMKKGLALSGLPKADAVTSIVVSFPEEGSVRVLTEREDISLALSLSRFLDYLPLPACTGAADSAVSFTCVLNDGSQVLLAADSEAVLWKGTWRTLKNKQTFVRLAKAYFLPAEAEPAGEQTAGTEQTLSEETIDWLIWYTSLSEEERQAVSFIPEEVRNYIGGNAADTEPLPVETDTAEETQ